MKTITLETHTNFIDALKYLIEGNCIGIKPGENTSYLEIYKPEWMNKESPDYILKWHDSENNEGIRTDQYFEKWFPVIVDHREIK